jgi:hypothetical protein
MKNEEDGEKEETRKGTGGRKSQITNPKQITIIKISL